MLECTAGTSLVDWSASQKNNDTFGCPLASVDGSRGFAAHFIDARYQKLPHPLPKRLPYFAAENPETGILNRRGPHAREIVYLTTAKGDCSSYTKSTRTEIP
jgi:hypothetical protein